MSDHEEELIGEFPVFKGRSYVMKLYENRMFIHNKRGVKLTISNLSGGHEIYLNNCHDSVFIVRNKIYNLTLDNCTNCTVKFQTIVAKIELIRCVNVELFCKYTTNIVQSDLINGMEFHINKKNILPKLYFSSISCWGLYLNVKETGQRYLIDSSMFLDHYLVKFKEDGTYTRDINVDIKEIDILPSPVAVLIN